MLCRVSSTAVSYTHLDVYKRQVCVDPDYRMRGIGKSMVVFCMNALRKEQISKVSLIAFTRNDVGNAFWRCIGWTKREDLNYYDFVLNEKNIERFNE